jgi:hypothetical protein
MELEMTKKNAAQPVQKSQDIGPNLDSRYGEIGISAVAAALHYKSVAKNPAYAPVVPQPDPRSQEMAEIAAA